MVYKLYFNIICIYLTVIGGFLHFIDCHLYFIAQSTSHHIAKLKVIFYL